MKQLTNFMKVMSGFGAKLDAKPLDKPVFRGDTVDTGLGRVPRVANDGGHDLIFRHTHQRPDGGLNVIYTHPTKRAFTRSGHPIRQRAMVVPLEKARIPA